MVKKQREPRPSDFLASVFKVERKIKGVHACINYIDKILESLDDKTPTSAEIITKPDLVETSCVPGGLPFIEYPDKIRREREKTLQTRCIQDGLYPTGIPTIDKSDPVWDIVNSIFNSVTKRKKGATWFSNPVNPEKMGCPKYFDYVKHPMDYSTIRHHLDSDLYAHPSQVLFDILLVYHNACIFNPETHACHQCAKEEQSYVLSRWIESFGYLPRENAFLLNRLSHVNARKGRALLMEDPDKFDRISIPETWWTQMEEMDAKEEEERRIFREEQPTKDEEEIEAKVQPRASGESDTVGRLPSSTKEEEATAGTFSEPSSMPILPTKILINAYNMLESGGFLRPRTSIVESELTKNFFDVKEKIERMSEVEKAYLAFCQDREIKVSEEFDVNELSDTAFNFLDFALRAYLCLYQPSRERSEYEERIVRVCESISRSE
ncbi:hypothetical protein ADUPG1_012405 [Aduncisulcus paluster]|uniref:Bromo domain-containing protein n=1 Tax=Aduncisulcus paluster TaxID=2918883 RepID=A0ABQ5K2N7_9EUKA|nr:hypothetical protein ADUPG1_012405 [Aduncisulcus paluster]